MLAQYWPTLLISRDHKHTATPVLTHAAQEKLPTHIYYTREGFSHVQEMATAGNVCSCPRWVDILLGGEEGELSNTKHKQLL